MVFVTGGTGLLGTHIILELLSRGKTVRALKRLDSNLDIVRSVFEFYLKDNATSEFDKIQWVDGDVLDIPSLEDGIKGCQQVFHCAAMVSFVKKDFNKMWKVNKIGTENLVNICLKENVDHLCHISSTSAVGFDRTKEFQVESNKWKNDSNKTNYAVTKYAAELEVYRGIEEGLSAVIINPSMIGPGNWDQSSLGIFKSVHGGLKFYTPGMNAFVDARDVATIAAELTNRKINGERYLVVSENYFFKDLFEQIANKFGIKPPSKLAKPWMASFIWKLQGLMRFFFGTKQTITRESAKSAMEITKFSNEKILKEINFEFIPVEESIENAVKFFDSLTLRD